MDKCSKFGHNPRQNNFGVSWCTECGQLFPFSMNHKLLHKNFLPKSKKRLFKNIFKN